MHSGEGETPDSPTAAFPQNLKKLEPSSTPPRNPLPAKRCIKRIATVGKFELAHCFFMHFADLHPAI